jgi:hypothetical protein
MLIFYPAMSLNFYSNFFGGISGVSTYKIMSSAHNDNLNSFPFWMLFISFYYLIALLRILSTIPNKSGESGLPCLLSDLRGKLSAFPGAV